MGPLPVRDTKKESKLSQDDIKAILAKVKEADFFALKERYEVGVTDNPTLILRITHDKKTHEAPSFMPPITWKMTRR